MATAVSIRIEIPGELPGPMDPLAAAEFLDRKTVTR